MYTSLCIYHSVYIVKSIKKYKNTYGEQNPEVTSTGDSEQGWKDRVTLPLFLKLVGSQGYARTFFIPSSPPPTKWKTMNVHIPIFPPGDACFFQASPAIRKHRLLLCPSWNTPHSFDPTRDHSDHPFYWPDLVMDTFGNRFRFLEIVSQQSFATTKKVKRRYLQLWRCFERGA